MTITLASLIMLLAALAMPVVADDVNELIQDLKDPIPTIREDAADALGKLNDTRAVEPLIQALNDENRVVRMNAAVSLGSLGDTRAVDPLIKALGDEDYRVREYAVEALGDINAVEPLIQALKDEDSIVRSVAAEALGKLNNSSAVEPLIQALKDEDSIVRSAAAEALVEFKNSSSVEPLIQVLQDEDAGVRWSAAEALRKLNDTRAAEPLIQYAAEASVEENMTAAAEAAPAAAAPIGFSVGGAKDISNFRENINQSYLPLPSDVTYEGLFYDYYFDTGAAQKCRKLFCPSYSYAVSKDPFSSEPQYYLSVGLNSGITDFQRKKLNLVVVLDFSGSMDSPFDEYYYDRFGNMIEAETAGEESSKTKMQIADESIVALLGHLKPEDRFGMVIFSDDAFLADPLTSVADKNLDRLKSRILRIRGTEGTNMEAGMKEGTALFDQFLQADKSEYENRIVFLTDAMPNIEETSDLGLFRMLEDNADEGIYTTFIGIGMDFNTELVESITKIKGANYYPVHSADEFKKRMVDEFDFMVTPLVFDLRLKLDAPGYEIEKVYGSPEADLATGELMKVNTLFPSKTDEGQVKGGVILVKLKKFTNQKNMRLALSYQERSGVRDSEETEVDMPESNADFYQNSGIKKAVLLTRYADLLKNWMIDERNSADKGWKVVPSVTLANGIIIPIELGEWERQSLPLIVSEPY